VKGASILLFEDQWALRHGIEAGKDVEFLETAP
jgi:hypothetical protein